MNKLIFNLFIAFPAAIITILVFFYLGLNSDVTAVAIPKSSFEWIAIVPYVLVIVLALVGVDVFSTLIIGTILAGLIGYFGNHFTLMEFARKIYEGFASMTEYSFHCCYWRYCKGNQ